MKAGCRAGLPDPWRIHGAGWLFVTVACWDNETRRPPQDGVRCLGRHGVPLQALERARSREAGWLRCRVLPAWAQLAAEEVRLGTPFLGLGQAVIEPVPGCRIAFHCRKRNVLPVLGEVVSGNAEQVCDGAEKRRAEPLGVDSADGAREVRVTDLKFACESAQAQLSLAEQGGQGICERETGPIRHCASSIAPKRYRPTTSVS